MRSSVGDEKRLTQTDRPPAAAAQGCDPAGTAILAATVGAAAPVALPAVVTARATRSRPWRHMARDRSICYGSVLSGQCGGECFAQLLECIADRCRVAELLRECGVDALQGRPAGAPLAVAGRGELEQLRPAVVRVRAAAGPAACFEAPHHVRGG